MTHCFTILEMATATSREVEWLRGKGEESATCLRTRGHAGSHKWVSYRDITNWLLNGNPSQEEAEAAAFIPEEIRGII